MAHEHDVVIVGGGMAGLATVRTLARDGRDVLLLEQFRLGHDRGSSHGSSRIVRLSHDDPSDVDRAQEAYRLWRELEAEVGEPLLKITGGLDLWDDLSRHEAALASHEVPFELLDAPEIARRFGICAPADVAGLFQPDGGIVLADLALRAFARSAQAHGATMLEEARVEAFEPQQDGVLVASTAGRHHAPVIVVAAGAWAKRLLDPLGIDVPVAVTRETVAYFRLPTGTKLPTLIESTATVHEAYALEAPRIGLKAAIHQTGVPADPDEPGRPDEVLVGRIADWVAQRLPVDAAEPVVAETCLYTSTSDERFLQERHGRIVVGSACSGRGFKFAPHTGNVLAGLACEVLAT